MCSLKKRNCWLIWHPSFNCFTCIFELEKIEISPKVISIPFHEHRCHMWLLTPIFSTKNRYTLLLGRNCIHCKGASSTNHRIILFAVHHCTSYNTIRIVTTNKFRMKRKKKNAKGQRARAEIKMSIEECICSCKDSTGTCFTCYEW